MKAIMNLFHLDQANDNIRRVYPTGSFMTDGCAISIFVSKVPFFERGEQFFPSIYQNSKDTPSPTGEPVLTESIGQQVVDDRGQEYDVLIEQHVDEDESHFEDEFSDVIHSMEGADADDEDDDPYLAIDIDDLVDEEQEASPKRNESERPPKKKRKKVSEKKARKDQENKKALVSVPKNSEYNAYVTIDPGGDIWLQILRTIDGVNFVRQAISSDRYYHDIKSNEHRLWSANKVTEFDIAQDIALLDRTRFRTLDASDFLDAVVAKLKKFNRLDAFYNENKFRERRLSMFISKQRAFSCYAKEIMGDYKNVVVGFGNWSQERNSPIKCRSLPTKSFRRYLQTQCKKLIPLDEYRTSKSCATCRHGEMKKLRVNRIDGKVKDGMFYGLACMH